MRRIARGIRRYVLESANPFIVKVNHGGQDFRGQDLAEPMHTVTSKLGSGVAIPYLIGAGGPEYSAKPKVVDSPFNTLATGNHTHVVAPYLTEHANGSTQRNFPADEPLRTQCAEVKGGHFAVVAPTLVQMGSPGQAPRSLDLGRPLGTVTAQGTKHALVGALMAKHYGGHYDGAGALLDGPSHTVTTADHHALVTAQLVTNTTGHAGAAADAPVPTLTTGNQQGLVTAQLVGCGGRAGQSRSRGIEEPAQTLTAKADTCVVTSNLVKLRGECTGSDTGEPVATVTASGTHIGEVRAFLVKYYGQGGQDQNIQDPMHTIPTKDRMGLVTVAGQEYQIADIGMRMLEPHELYAAQGFPSNYVIAPGDKRPALAEARPSADVRQQRVPAAGRRSGPRQPPGNGRLVPPGRQDAKDSSMTNSNSAAQAAPQPTVLTRQEVGELYKDWVCIFGVNAGSAELCIREIESAVLAKRSSPVAGEVVAWAAIPSRGTRAGRIYSTCDTRKEIDAYIELVHQSNDSLTLTPRPLSFADAAPQASAEAFDFVVHLARQAEFSARTFGPGARVAGVCDHIRKELIEVETSGGDLKEWVDVIILGLDGAWRSGATPQEIIAAIVAKQAKNEARTWPDWRTMDPNKAIEHQRDAAPRAYPSGDGPLRNPCPAHPEGGSHGPASFRR